MEPRPIVSEVLALELPLGSYVVIGSGTLSAYGIREHNDIDLFVTPTLYATLKARGWEECEPKPGFFLARHGSVEASPDMATIKGFAPSHEELLSRAVVLDGVPFMSLPDLIAFKRALGRAKDFADIILIEEYLERVA
jgi:hypothetical protein